MAYFLQQKLTGTQDPFQTTEWPQKLNSRLNPNESSLVEVQKWLKKQPLVVKSESVDFIKPLGEGANSEVYQGNYLNRLTLTQIGMYNGGFVAIKVMKFKNAQKEIDKQKTDLKKEVEIMSLVDSPYVLHPLNPTSHLF